MGPADARNNESDAFLPNILVSCSMGTVFVTVHPCETKTDGIDRDIKIPFSLGAHQDAVVCIIPPSSLSSLQGLIVAAARLRRGWGQAGVGWDLTSGNDTKAGTN